MLRRLLYVKCLARSAELKASVWYVCLFGAKFNVVKLKNKWRVSHV